MLILQKINKIERIYIIMQKALLIAEKPSLMRDIQNAYKYCKDKVSYDITFVSQAGHLVELLDPVELNPIYKKWDVDLLPIDPDKEGGWKYKVTRKSKDLYDNIKKEINSGKYDVIIHAGDPDQEGELLVNLVLKKIGNKLPVLRLWSNDTTQKNLMYALQHLRNDNEPQFQNLYAAALLRQHTDWSFGMNGSRAIADRIYAGRDNKIAAGRVMTWVQTAIVDREDEINNFVPKTTYGVKVLYNDQLESNLYEPKDVISSNDSDNDDNDDKTETGFVYFETENEARAVLNDLSSTGKVISYKTTKTTTYAPKLYKLATIQMDAGKDGYSPSRTLEIIQSLYEKHYVSYPRTDCEIISSNENLPDIIASAGTVVGFEDAAKYALTQTSRILGMKKFVNDKELQKHGHSALIPTSDAPDFKHLTDDERYIYTLIAKRFLAIFQPPLIQDKMTVLTDSNSHIFRSSGKRVVDPGYTTFLGIKVQDIQIPNLNEGDILNITNKSITEKTTVCPKRFDSNTLIAAMENPSKYLIDKTIKDDISDLKIGTSSTRGAVIDKIIKDGYVAVKKGYYVPTDFGSFMIHTLKGISLCRIDTTGHWEQILNKVKFGEISPDEASAYMKKQVENLIQDIKGVNKVSYGNATMDRQIVMTCPGCGKDIIAGPRNYYCAGYRDGCKYSMMKSFLGADFSPEDIKTLFSGGIIEKTLTKKDKSAKWNQKLKFNTTEGKLDFVIAQEEEIDIHCPDCHETLYSQGKKIFCKSCNFAIWRSVAGKDLSDKEMKQIIENGQSLKAIDGFKSKKGTTFKAILKLKRNGNKSGFDFVF